MIKFNHLILYCNSYLTLEFVLSSISVVWTRPVQRTPSVLPIALFSRIQTQLCSTMRKPFARVLIENLFLISKMISNFPRDWFYSIEFLTFLIELSQESRMNFEFESRTPRRGACRPTVQQKVTVISCVESSAEKLLKNLATLDHELSNSTLDLIVLKRTNQFHCSKLMWSWVPLDTALIIRTVPMFCQIFIFKLLSRPRDVNSLFLSDEKKYEIIEI